MVKLKWFAGGTDRATQAIEIIDELLSDLPNTPNEDALKNVLLTYRHEFVKKSTSVPFILSRMSLAVSNVLEKNEITLTNSQSSKLKQLISLSSIRYGY